MEVEKPELPEKPTYGCLSNGKVPDRIENGNRHLKIK
jgi:hypothetical protein